MTYNDGRQPIARGHLSDPGDLKWPRTLVYIVEVFLGFFLGGWGVGVGLDLLISGSIIKINLHNQYNVRYFKLHNWPRISVQVALLKLK